MLCLSVSHILNIIRHLHKHKGDDILQNNCVHNKDTNDHNNHYTRIHSDDINERFHSCKDDLHVIQNARCKKLQGRPEL
jgi:nicotinamide riboside kinase